MNILEHPIVFTIFGLPISDTVVFTWIVMGLIVLLVLLLKLIRPDLLELLLEMIVSIVEDAIDSDELYAYLPLLGSLLVFTLVANLSSVIPGMKSPTGDLNTTIALALVVVFSVHIYGIKKKGLWTYLKEFASPIFLFPLELIGQLSRTLSLSLRLFGNVLSGDLVVAIVFSIIPFFVPSIFASISIISGALQAYVLTSLAAIFISSAVEINEEDSKIKAEKRAASQAPKLKGLN